MMVWKTTRAGALISVVTLAVLQKSADAVGGSRSIDPKSMTVFGKPERIFLNCCMTNIRINLTTQCIATTIRRALVWVKDNLCWVVDWRVEAMNKAKLVFFPHFLSTAEAS